MLLASSLAVAIPFLASPSCAAPLYEPDQGGFAGILHLPDSNDGADLLPPTSHAFAMSVATASHSVIAARGEERLILDGETTQAAVSYRFRRNGELEFGIDVPYVWHSSGELDGFIDSWHDIFSLPVGYRTQRPEDVLQISYADANGQQVDLRNGTSGVGDIRLTAGWQTGGQANSKTALRFGIKLPTGDSAALRGTGSTDVSVGVARDVRELWGSPRLNGMLRGNAIFVGKPDILADRYRKFVAQISAGLGYQLTDAVELRVQATTRSALYDSEIEMLGEPSASLAVGGNISLSPRMEISIAVAEDIKAESSADVAFQLAFRYRPE